MKIFLKVGNIMDPERAWIFNGVVNKLFADAHTKNVNDVDMAVSALSTYNSLDDENFADGFAQDFEQAGKALGHPLDVDDIRNVENAAKDFADAHKSYGNVKATGLGLVTFNGEYLNTIRGDYESDGTSTVYTGNTIDAKYHQAVGDYDDDYKAQVAQKEENYKLKNRQEFNDLLKNVFEPRKGVYNEVTIDFAQDELAEKIDAGGGDALHTVADNFSDAVERLDVEDAFKESGGIDTVYVRTGSFAHDYYDYGLKEVSFEDVIRENSDALIQSGEKDVFTPETLAKNFDAIRQYSNEVQYGDGEDDYEFDEPVDEKDIVDSKTFDTKMRTVWADSNRQFYDDEPAKPTPSKTMAGKDVELMVNSLRPIHYKNKAGEQQLGVLVDAVKRGDVASQPSKFDGSHVVNTYTSYGKESHVQMVSPESAKQIMAVNGYANDDQNTGAKFIDDSAFEYAADKKYDYGKELAKRGKTMTFTANVFSPEGTKYGDFKFNPNPEKIGKSDVPFDVETHAEAVKARDEEHAKNLAKYKEKQASQKDEGLEP